MNSVRPFSSSTRSVRATSAASAPSEDISSASSRLIGPKQPAKDSIQTISTALIREYLAAHKLDKTLEVFKQEVKKENLITSRAALASELGISKAVQANRELEDPFVSYLEVLVNQTVLRSKKSLRDQKYKPSTESQLTSTPNIIEGKITTQSEFKSDEMNQNKTSSYASQILRNLKLQDTLTNSSEKESDRMIKRAVETSTESPTYLLSRSQQFKTELQSKPSKHNATGQTSNQDVQIFDDLETSDEDPTEISLFQSIQAGSWKDSRGTKISPHMAGDLKRILFPDDKSRLLFPDEWRNKGFVFNDKLDLAYGITQLKGGPCGLIAAIQANVIKYLTSDPSLKCIKDKCLRPTAIQSQMALLNSLADCIWKAGEHQSRGIVVISSNNPSRSEIVTDDLEFHQFNNRTAVYDFIQANILQFMANDTTSHGIIQILLSVILSRGIETIRNDLDEREGRLMGRHGYCTQEMVNLVLMGEAISNIHDGDINLGGEGSERNILKGIKRQCDIGQLSLFEHYNNIRVGDNMKNPKLPIFIICSESHYTVLFCTDAKDLPPKSSELINPKGYKFDMFYYDQLANQSEEIRLTITSDPKSSAPKSANYKHSVSGKTSTAPVDHNRDLVPPLELCIRTKWVNAHVDWNQTEPLL